LEITFNQPNIEYPSWLVLFNLTGLRESQGRWEARISEGSRQAKLLFASEEEAAKAYDK
jgi:hypothetical protein